MARKKQKPVMPGDQQLIDQYKHKDKSRLNNPQVGMVNNSNDPQQASKKYSYDPHLDPTLIWTGKKEQSELRVDTVSIHVHERIDPKTVIQQVHKSNIEDYQHSLFEPMFDQRPIREEVSFYKHKNAWANRLIAGDSLLVMNSLLEKEGMAGQVQMVYMDPPYGIKYGSNFQPFVNQRNVVDGLDDDLSSEPEMIKAFRDTWELGIHSYLSYMRDRLLLAKDMLSETGSCFVQISDQNLHHVRELMDEIFGINNFCSIIIFRKTGSESSTLTGVTTDFIVWYAKDIKKVKYRQLFFKKNPGEEGAKEFKRVELEDGTIRPITRDEMAQPDLLPKGARVFATWPIISKGHSDTNSGDLVFVEGKKTYTLRCPKGNHWKLGAEGTRALWNMGRLLRTEGLRIYKKYLDDFPYSPINSLWTDTRGETNMQYVVQTATQVVQRCLLMTTDPGDLVVDPTCGSGTTAFVAEDWGRRWITIDTSRVSLHLAKQRIMTACYKWYRLAHTNEGVGGGFVYENAENIVMSAAANNTKGQEITLYDKPLVDKDIVRVSGPFTVEAIPATTVKPLSDILNKQVDVNSSITRTGETARQDDWRSELQKTGVRAKGGMKIEFVRVELIQGTRYIHAEAETIDAKRVLVSFGPDHAPLDQKQVELALEEAGNLKPAPNMVLFAAFQFDPEASKDIDETNWAGVELLKAQMNTDLLTSDLKKKQSSSESFWLVGQPDVEVTKDKDGKFAVSVNGFDYYNPKSGEVQSGGKKEIAMWMLDTDYDGRSIFPTQIFFPMASAKDGWNKIAKNLKAELNEDLLEKFEGTESILFSSGDYKRCAVKIIDNRGIESFCIKNLD